MSDEKEKPDPRFQPDPADEAAGYPFNTGEWWWLAGYLLSAAQEEAMWRCARGGLPPVEWKQTPLPSGIEIEGIMDGERVLFLSITATRTQTFVTVADRFPFERFWTQIIKTCLATERHAREMHRTALTRRYEALLEDYYQRRQRLEPANLREMSEQYGVNYASLRQYKIRYDKRLRELLVTS